MPDTVSVVYVGVHDEVYLPALGNLQAKRAEPVDVPKDAAGRPGKPGTVVGDPGAPDYEVTPAEHGEGLLAQTDNWVLAKDHHKPKARAGHRTDAEENA